MRKVLFLFLSTLVFADLSASCVDEVKLIYADFSKISKPDKRTSYHINFSILTNYWNNIPASRMNVNVIYSYNFYSVLSDNMSMYMDKNESIAIVSSNKLIYRMDSKLGTVKDSSFSPIQMKLFDLVESHECKNVSGNSKYNTIINLKMNSKAQKDYYTKNVIMYYNSSKKSLYKTIIEYSKPYPCSRIEFTYNTLNFNYKNSVQSFSAISKVVDAKNNLLPAFSGYKLIDARERNIK